MSPYRSPFFEVSKIEGSITGQDELGPGTCSVSACFPAELGADDFLPAKGPRGLDNRYCIPGVQEEIAAAPLLVEPTESTVPRVTCSLYLKPPLKGDKQGPCKANVPRNCKMVTSAKRYYMWSHGQPGRQMEGGGSCWALASFIMWPLLPQNPHL